MTVITGESIIYGFLRGGKELTVSVSDNAIGYIKLTTNTGDPQIKDLTSLRREGDVKFGPNFGDIDVQVYVLIGQANINYVQNDFIIESSYVINDGLVTDLVSSKIVPVLESRTLLPSDDGKTLDCAEGVILTIPNGWGEKGCAVRPEGTQIACANGVTTNGTDTTKTLTVRIGAINPTANSTDYDLLGAA